MEIKVVSGDITKQNIQAIVVNLFEGTTNLAGATKVVDQALGGIISELVKDGEAKGNKGEMTLIHTLGMISPTRVVVAGLGNPSDLDEEAVRIVSSKASYFLRGKGVQKIATIAHGTGMGGMDPLATGRAVAEGSILGLYQFNKYKSADECKNEIEELTIIEVDSTKINALQKGVSEGTLLANATNLCRNMVNEPANIMTPTRMAEVALEIAQNADLEIKILDRSQITKLGMGALLGVAQGSDEPPKLIVLKYLGDPGNKANNVGLLGKGITFDSGGISIKPALNMGEMKTDMAGGAAVISALSAISKFKPKINVIAIVPATENMPGGKAQRPGDIVKTMSGKTIEIDNTDAEGRLVLADALTYAQSLGLHRIIDVATLTGAVVVALGKICTAVFGNDQIFIDQVLEAATQTGERFWQMPTYDDYKNQYKSNVADMKNTGGRGAGSITGAQIIGEFATDSSWVHLDIAGTSRSDTHTSYNPKGATGVPVRTLVRLVQNLAESQ